MLVNIQVSHINTCTYKRVDDTQLTSVVELLAARITSVLNGSL